MKFLLAMVAMVLASACIEEAERFPDETTCGKCVEVWHTVAIEHAPGFISCIEYTETGVLCCELRGDDGCPTEPRKFAWRACDDDGSPAHQACMDSDAATPVGQSNPECVSPSVGCDWATDLPVQ